jgi:maltose alpha-D-glucosyltransferase/alpha-amylase
MTSRLDEPNDDPLWFKDAIVYELRTRSFYDSNGDGIGDLAGMTAKLDYVKDLGITAIWILPICPSPGKDDGYDIADYVGIHADVGTLADFKEVVFEARRRGIRIITELVLNHTSDAHPWFQRARRAPPGSVERDFYVWSDTPDRYREARIIFQDFERSNWAWDPMAGAYYWHRFFAHQPDLNYENPAVHQAIFDVVDFWFGLGVDGLRLDAVPYLYEAEGTTCENLEQTHDFLKKLRAHIDGKWKNRVLLAEANQWPEDAAAYFGAGNECHLNFHFPIMPRLFMSIHMEDRFPIIDILAQTPALPENCQWAMFLRNHDELTLETVTDEERDYMHRVYASDPAMRVNLGIRRRLAPLVGNDRRKMELLNGLLFSLPGTPVLYYGDEIGMGDNVYLGDRNGVRTPMQWSADRNAGFSRTNPQRLILPVIIDPEYHFEAINVEAQQGNASSLLWWTKRLIALRKQHRAFGRGSIDLLNPDNPHVLAFVRAHEGETILVVANLSRFTQYVELDLTKWEGARPTELFGRARFPPVADRPYPLTLGGFAFYWMTLERPPDSDTKARLEGYSPPSIGGASLRALTAGAERATLEDIFPAFLQTRPWFRGHRRRIEVVRVRDAVSLGDADRDAVATLVTVEYASGEPETYLVPLVFVARTETRSAPAEAVVALARLGGTEGVLVDALHDAASSYPVLNLLLGGNRAPGRAGEIVGTAFATGLTEESPGEAKVVSATHANAAIRYGDRFLLKVYRRLEPGPSPELEVGRLVSERAPGLVPRFVGAMEYRSRYAEPLTLAVLQHFVPNEGTGWEHALREVGLFYERVLASSPDEPEAGAAPSGPLASHAMQELPPELAKHMGTSFAAAMLLGTRTAELHLTLASATDDPAFLPEPFSPFDRRSVYQSYRNLVGRVVREIRARRAEMPARTAALAEALVGRERAIVDRMAPLLVTTSGGNRIRIHGDYHLGQVLHTGKDYVLIDFDGAGRSSLEERRRKRSALRDVASMVRSFAHVAHVGRTRGAVVREADQASLASRERLWGQWTAAAFLRGYFERAGRASFLPAEEDVMALLLDRYVLAEALHELDDGMGSGMSDIDVPLFDVLHMLET